MEGTLSSTVRLAGPRGSAGLVCKPFLFLLLESRRPLDLSLRFDLNSIERVEFGRGQRRSFERIDTGDVGRLVLRVPDPWMSSRHALIERRGPRWVFSDRRSTNGSVLNGNPIDEADLADGDIIELGQTFFLFRSELLVDLIEPEVVDAKDLDPASGMASLLPSLAKQFADLGQIINSETPVLIVGASGTGKGVVAKAAHALSQRQGKFVTINCVALPANAMLRELLTADGGTLLLDEVADLSLECQALLLRVLQERAITPSDGTEPVPVDFRLVCTTQHDIEVLVAKGEFREDLFARIFGFVLELPPLCQRMEDFGMLLGSLLDELYADQEQVSISVDAARALLGYTWPRNTRELRTCLQAAIALSGGTRIDLAHLLAPVRMGLQDSTAGKR